MRNLNLDQLQTLIAIADLGTLAAAAQALHLAPPTISLHLSELESRLGTALLVRGRRQSTLTAAGRALVEGGRRLLTDSDELLAAVRRRAEGREGPVRVAATAGISVQLLPQVLAALGAASPGVAIKLDLLSSANAMARLRDGALDLAIVALPLGRSGEVHVTHWRSDSMLAFVPAAWDTPARITPQWLVEHGWMSFGAGTQMHALIAAWFGRAGLNPRPAMEINHPAALLSLVAAGQGVALLPLEGDPADARHATVRTRPLRPALTRQLGIACRTVSLSDASVQSVLRVLKGFGNVGPGARPGRRAADPR
jgi:DNA-binding transcriptional LysR family regulator